MSWKISYMMEAVLCNRYYAWHWLLKYKRKYQLGVYTTQIQFHWKLSVSLIHMSISWLAEQNCQQLVHTIILGEGRTWEKPIHMWIPASLSKQLMFSNSLPPSGGQAPVPKQDSTAMYAWSGTKRRQIITWSSQRVKL